MKTGIRARGGDHDAYSRAVRFGRTGHDCAPIGLNGPSARTDKKIELSDALTRTTRTLGRAMRDRLCADC